MKYQRMIRAVKVLFLVILAVCLGGCSVSLGGFSLGKKEELVFFCREEEASSEAKTEPEEVLETEETDSQPEASKTGITADGRVDINTASVEELMTLSGIGETRARAIVEYRTQNGPFTKAEDIMLIPGIKEGIYSKIQAQIIVY